MSTFVSAAAPSTPVSVMYTLSYVASCASHSRFAFSCARYARVASRTSAETAQQMDRIIHGMWFRGWYFFCQYCGPAELPTAYPIMTIAFVVSRFVCPAVVDPTHASITTKGVMDVTARAEEERGGKGA